MGLVSRFSAPLAYPAAFLCLVACALGFLAAPARAAEPMALSWADLMPEGEEERLEELYTAFMTALQEEMSAGGGSTFMGADPGMIGEGSPLDQMTQIGTFNTVSDLDGAEIRIPGYVVPFDFSAEGLYTEFLLVPYFGACIHSPPPPPNQIIYVTADEPVEIGDIWSPIFAEGELAARRHLNDTGNAAYTLSLGKIEPYDYPQ